LARKLFDQQADLGSFSTRFRKLFHFEFIRLQELINAEIISHFIQLYILKTVKAGKRENKRMLQNRGSCRFYLNGTATGLPTIADYITESFKA
jgi:hypothetical protein